MNSVIINNKPYTKDSKGFYIMPNELHYLLYDLGLTAQEKLVYECLIRYSNNSENNPFPSYSTLQKFASCGRNTVAKSLKKLQELNLVQVLERGSNLKRKSNIYKINYVYSNEAIQEVTEPASSIDNIKPLPQPKEAKKQPQKAVNNNSRQDVKIPYRKGVHEEVQTSKEAKELVEYWESTEGQKQLVEYSARVERLFTM